MVVVLVVCCLLLLVPVLFLVLFLVVAIVVQYFGVVYYEIRSIWISICYNGKVENKHELFGCNTTSLRVL